MNKLKISELFDLSGTLASEYLSQFEYPWDALCGIGELVEKIGATLNCESFEMAGQNIWISKTAKVAPGACISGPCIIGHYTEIRHCAYIRGAALIGDGCVVGNSTELKNCILFNGVQVPHYNYVGDSILGNRAHMGAGAITSNVKSDKTPVVIRMDEYGSIETGRKKVGALIGDGVEIGCGAVLNPGSVIGKNSTVYPLTSVRGFVPENSICKQDGSIVPKI